MPPAAATATVAVLWGKGFEPARVAVRVGATVTWKRARASTAILEADVRDSGRGRGRGSEGPDADPDAEPTKLVWIDDAEDADEHEVSSSRTFSRTFRRAGRYEYQCGNLVFMRGVVDVVDVDADVAEAEAEDSSSREGSGSDAGESRAGCSCAAARSCAAHRRRAAARSCASARGAPCRDRAARSRSRERPWRSPRV